MNIFLNLLFGFIISGVAFMLILVFDFIAKFFIDNKNITRGIIHIFFGFVSIFLALHLLAISFIIIIIISFFIIFPSYKLKLLSSIHGVHRKTYGELFLPTGILFAYIFSFSNIHYFIAVVLILTLADPIAGFVGSYINKNKKTNVGSIAFYIVTFIILYTMFPQYNIIYIAIIGLIITLVERISILGADDITIPLSALALIYLLALFS